RISGLRSHTQKGNQSLRPQHRDQPVGFLSARRRIVTQISRKPWLPIELHPPCLPRYFQSRISLSQFSNQRLRRVLQCTFACICLRLAHAHDHSIRKPPALRDTSVRRKGHASLVLVFLPVFWNL